MEASSSSAATSSSHRGGGRELQGPRPAPLRVRKESHKIIRKPPQQVREPVIIYTVSPKVVHAQPSEFMSVVQRLTGGGGTAAHHHQILPIPTTSPPSLPFPFFGGAGAGAPPSSSAAPLRFPPPAPHFPFQLPQHELMTTTELSPAARSSGGAEGSGLLMPPFPGVLSPGSLPAIQPASFFSPPPPGGAGINLFGELISPAAAFLGPAASATSTTAAGHQNLMSLQQEAASPSAGGAYYWGDLFNNQHYHQN